MKWLNEKVQKLFTVWASLKPPTCNEDDCGLFCCSAAVLWTFRGQRAQSMESDHSSSQQLRGGCEVSVHNTSNPTQGPVHVT